MNRKIERLWLIRRIVASVAATVFLCAWFGLVAPQAMAAKGTSRSPDPIRTLPMAYGVININEASITELTYLPGIGVRKAERIVNYRKRRAFRRVIHLARVKGIGLKTVRRLKPYLRVKGPTTLTRPIRRR